VEWNQLLQFSVTLDFEIKLQSHVSSFDDTIRIAEADRTFPIAVKIGTDLGHDC
jgi:hypothetical protein